MIQGIVFDMDGVLIDSEPLWHNAQITFGKKREPLDLAGVTIDEWVRRVNEYHELGMSDDALKNELEKYVTANYKNLKAIPGAQQTVRELSKHYPLAVASNASPKIIELTLEKLELKDYFNFIISGEECERSKPDPEIYLRAAAGLGLNPWETLAIEDSLPGLQAALAARTRVSFLLNENTTIPGPTLRQVDYQLNRLGEVCELLLPVS